LAVYVITRTTSTDANSVGADRKNNLLTKMSACTTATTGSPTTTTGADN